ncbi:MAG: glycoside hydrolase family 97 protein [Acidobacteria bacterium]|nr:glycoside hydrolase family 97 protein [Acidobacteriota bacterium]MBV9927157.1 glycoside hydrolase family 97 protein [Acidobacteriota bacterium]
MHTSSKRALPLLVVLFCLAVSASARQQGHSVFSPNRKIELRVYTSGRLSYDVLVNGKTLLRGSTLSLDVEHRALGLSPKVLRATPRAYEGWVEPVVRQKFARIREAYNELRLELDGNYAVTFRVYDEGAAYRFETSLPQAEVKVYGEEAAFNFAGDYTAFYPQEESLFSHNERVYAPKPLKEIAPAAFATLPAVVDAEGVKVAVAESDVEGYPGLWLRGTGGNGLAAMFPPYPLKEELKGDRDFRVTEAADYIAVTKGTRTYPWRLLGVAERDGDLVTNQLVYLLESPSRIQDTSWIKPGKVAWDWWNANNVYGVDFKSGVNTETYKYYIDFASKYGLQYIILDEGWYKRGNVLEVVPEIDVQELVDYGRRKNVGVILWVVWKTLDDQMEPALNQFEKWGVRGIKVDFMQRDDQKVIDFYYKLTREAARRKMLVDYHGGQRPALMTRTWPNLISTEGVRGLEWSKWSAEANPEHNLSLPFTRMFLGPMDYTPGAMLNAQQKSWAKVFDRPVSLGTRCHQLAMYVVFESPLQMLADSPSNYLREPEAMEFLSAVPSVWDETRVLDAKIGDYVVVARRSGRDWYVGAMTDWTARELDVDFSFLPEGAFRMDSYQDGVNAGRFAGDYKKVSGRADRTTRLKIKLAEGGGWAAHLRP